MFAVRMLLSLFVFVSFTLGGDAFAAAGKIEEVGQGTLVKVTREGAVVRLKKGDALQSGDEVATDAETAVDIRLEDDTLIRIGVNSSYKVQEDSKINSLIHRLLTGVVRVMVPKSAGKNTAVKFRMFTPEGTIGVRGTEFVVIRSDGKTQLKGLDGEVMFGPADADFENAGAFVLVGRGFDSEISAGGKAASKPAKFDQPKYLQEIGSKGGLFGPLASRGGNVKVHARRDNSGAAAAPVVTAAPVPAKAPPADKSIGAKKKPVVAGTNWLKVLLKGAYDGDMDKVKQALGKGADINGVDKDVGFTALQVAMSENSTKHKEMVIYLIKRGASVNVRNKQGLTPLMVVAEEQLDMEYAKALVYPGGADIDAVDKNKRMAQDIAREKGYNELADYLESKEAGDDAERALTEKSARKADK